MPDPTERLAQLEAMRAETERWTTGDRDASLEAIDAEIALVTADVEATEEADLDAIAAAVRAAGVPATVEQTGGGTATVYVGDVRTDEYGDERYAVVIGPGWFDGPGWTNARAYRGEASIGPDDGGESPATAFYAIPEATADAAALVLALVRGETPTGLPFAVTCGACGIATYGSERHECDLAYDADLSIPVQRIYNAVMAEVLAQLDELSDDVATLCLELAHDDDDPDDPDTLDRATAAWQTTADDLRLSLRAAVLQRGADWLADNG